MEAWVTNLIRQAMLYSIPLVISLAAIAIFERQLLKRSALQPLRLSWQGLWLPLAASLMFGRAMIVALPHPSELGLRAALVRAFAHLLLMLVGFSLYTWALAHPPMTGLPPLHHWWAKVLMYFNLCMLCVHLLPLPTLVMGEWLLAQPRFSSYKSLIQMRPVFFLLPFTLLAASPLLDWSLGGLLVFPVYEQLASWAEVLGR